MDSKAEWELTRFLLPLNNSNFFCYFSLQMLPIILQNYISEAEWCTFSEIHLLEHRHPQLFPVCSNGSANFTFCTDKSTIFSIVSQYYQSYYQHHFINHTTVYVSLPSLTIPETYCHTLSEQNKDAKVSAAPAPSSLLSFELHHFTFPLHIDLNWNFVLRYYVSTFRSHASLSIHDHLKILLWKLRHNVHKLVHCLFENMISNPYAIQFVQICTTTIQMHPIIFKNESRLI